MNNRGFIDTPYGQVAKGALEANFTIPEGYNIPVHLLAAAAKPAARAAKAAWGAHSRQKKSAPRQKKKGAGG